MAKSIVDKLSHKLSPVLRNLSDLRIKKLLGIETQVLRIAYSNEDSLGQSDETIESNIIDNVTIQYPSGDIRIHMDRDNVNEQIDMSSFDLWDILPIKLQIPFKPNTNYDTEAVAIQEGDIIVNVFLDENDNKIPIVMQVTKVLGNFRTRFLVKKNYNLTLYRSIPEAALQTAIDTYVNNLTFP